MSSSGEKESSSSSPVELSRRTKKILQAVVKEYLQSGEAVGSRTVTRRHGIDLSSATVRNVMADLEELGLLNQPHTSAGRVPTGKGLRVFIDSLLTMRSLSAQEKEDIRKMVGVHTASDLDEVVQNTSRTLSEVTRHAGIVLAPDPRQSTFCHVEFLPLSKHRYLCVLVTADGQIENKLIESQLKVPTEQLERIHNYVNELMFGRTLDEVRERVITEFGKEKNQYDSMVAAALCLSKAVVEKRPREVAVHVHGGANLLAGSKMGDENDLARMQELLRALEDKKILLTLLDNAKRANRVKVFIGTESDIEVFGESSIVAMPYGLDNSKPIGAIAVIGPTWMNYAKVMSVVDFTAAMVSRLLSSGAGSDG